MFHSPGSCLLPKTRTEQTPSLLEGDMISAWLCKAPYVKDIFVSESAHEAALPINRGLYLWVSLGRVFTPEKKILFCFLCTQSRERVRSVHRMRYETPYDLRALVFRLIRTCFIFGFAVQFFRGPFLLYLK
jgi:hypothetical protein